MQINTQNVVPLKLTRPRVGQLKTLYTIYPDFLKLYESVAFGAHIPFFDYICAACTGEYRHIGVFLNRKGGIIFEQVGFDDNYLPQLQAILFDTQII